MTYKIDPSRWTEPNTEVPDVLRAPFAAARSEGPNDLQMRTLALKLAAISAGTAAAATAGTAKAASSTAGGATMASTGTFSMAKIAISVALFGATVTGAVVWQGKSARQTAQRTPAAQVAEGRAAEPTQQIAAESAEARRTSSLGVKPAGAPATQAVVSPVVVERMQEAQQALPETSQVQGAGSATARAPSAEDSRSAQRTAPAARAVSSRSRAAVPAASAPTKSVSTSSSTTTVANSEVDLLRRARAALAARPREAFAITQEHRSAYPGGMFAQERDVLAIEALMRAGELDTARSLAERFVREHPSSPHAHRFRETMGLR